MSSSRSLAARRGHARRRRIAAATDAVRNARTLACRERDLNNPVVCTHCGATFGNRESAWRHRGGDPTRTRCAPPESVGLYQGLGDVWFADHAEVRRLDAAREAALAAARDAKTAEREAWDEALSVGRIKSEDRPSTAQ